GVVVERLAAVGPPGVRSFDLAVDVAPDIDPAESGARGAVYRADLLPVGAEEAVEVPALARKETGLLAVAAPVLDVELAVPDVEVARDDGESVVRREGAQTRAHGIEELPLLVL